MSLKRTEVYREDFLGVKAYDAVSAKDGYKAVITASSGSPTIASITPAANGAIALTCDDTSEAQLLVLTQNDVLNLSASKIQKARFIVSEATLSTNGVVMFGLTGNHNSTYTSVSPQVAFIAAGGLTVKVRTNDGTHDSTAITTTAALSTSFQTFEIDFTNGLSDVRFYVLNASGQRTRLAPTTTFDASAITGSLQVYLRCHKASSTETPILNVDLVEVEYKR